VGIYRQDKAYHEARRKVLGKRRGLALIKAYDDPILNAKVITEYLCILKREGIERW